MDLRKIADAFVFELTKADKGEKTSLAYIKNSLSTTKLLRRHEQFQVMVVGGTTFRTCLARHSDYGELIRDIVSVDQPSFRTQEKLFSFLLQELRPTTRFVALNFAYPIKPTTKHGILDATLLHGTKENTFDGLKGNLVGQSFAAYVYEKRHQRIHVSVANDTVCLLLSGTTEYPPEDLAGGIVGTGSNLAFFLDEETIINLESGNFDKFSQTLSGKYIDSHSQNKGKQLFEKEVSGAYLFAHYNYEMIQKEIPFIRLTGTDGLDRLIQEHEDTSPVAKDILRRSASFTACQITGLMEFRKKSLTFIMQGSLFLKGQDYQEIVEHVCHTLNPHYTPTFIEIKNADLLGAAKLLN